MSNRPKWFSSVVVICVLAFISATLPLGSVEAQEWGPVEATSRPDIKVNEIGGEKKEIIEELFPYTMTPFRIENTESANLITASTYVYSFQNGVSLEDMSSGTTELIGGSLDDNASAVTDIGFDFWYDGARQTQFSINANGLLKFGSTVIATTFNNSTSGLGTTTNAPKVAPYFEDLCTGSDGKVHYKIIGSAPNRRLVVEWLNMEVPRDGGCSNAPATGVFQVWLFESESSTTPGRIQFVYGPGINASDDTDLGASVGLQSGAATNFASVTVTDDSVSYVAANNTNLPGIAAGKSYIFTPNGAPAAPTGLSFSNVTALSQQLNWTDNATGEVGYAIFRSTDGTNFSFIAQTAADAVSFNDTLLLPTTNYFYSVRAVGEGAVSSALTGSNSTNAPGSLACAGAGGNWSDSAIWGGSVPTSSDNVTIQSGCTVTVDTTTAVALSVTINSGGTLQAVTGTTNNLTIGGSLTNNGVLDFSTNGDTTGGILTFGAGLPDATFGGSGATTDVRAITIAKTTQAQTVELTATNFTVQSVNTDVAGFLTLTSGTFKISGTFTVTNRVFTAAAYTIPAGGGFWLNNP
ncbi:MAG TPA: fibronectin type III domain-containing protein, partial [Pyrinomonadaceae bacterium]|nr:fibronectin type III domain-containing protein [Pyrinomonadaceae bacterium]